MDGETISFAIHFVSLASDVVFPNETQNHTMKNYRPWPFDYARITIRIENKHGKRFYEILRCLRTISCRWPIGEKIMLQNFRQFFNFSIFIRFERLFGAKIT